MEELSTGSTDDYETRQRGVVEQFVLNIGTRVLIFTETYPFFIVGLLVKVESDFAYIVVELNNINELDGTVIRTHINEIIVFYFETEDVPIPSIQI